MAKPHKGNYIGSNEESKTTTATKCKRPVLARYRTSPHSLSEVSVSLGKVGCCISAASW